MVVGKVVAHLCLTLNIKELKFSVEHDRVVTTLNIIFSLVDGSILGCEIVSLCDGKLDMWSKTHSLCSKIRLK